MSAPLIADLTDPQTLREALIKQLPVGALEVSTTLSVPLLSPLTVLVLLREGRTVTLTGRAVAPMPGPCSAHSCCGAAPPSSVQHVCASAFVVEQSKRAGQRVPLGPNKRRRLRLALRAFTVQSSDT